VDVTGHAAKDVVKYAAGVAYTVVYDSFPLTDRFMRAPEDLAEIDGDKATFQAVRVGHAIATVQGAAGVAAGAMGVAASLKGGGGALIAGTVPGGQAATAIGVPTAAVAGAASAGVAGWGGYMMVKAKQGLQRLDEKEAKVAKENTPTKENTSPTKAEPAKTGDSGGAKAQEKSPIPEQQQTTPTGSDSGDVASPNAAMRKRAQGQYVDPMTNKTIKTTEPLPADHIVPQREIKSRIKEAEKSARLTREQKSEVLNLPENTQGLPKTYNSSKGGKMPSEWTTYKGQPLHPDYVTRNTNLEKTLLQQIQDMINSFTQKPGS
jgi:hypothetical protein